LNAELNPTCHLLALLGAHHILHFSRIRFKVHFNPLNAELNPTCHLLALLGAHHIFHVNRIRVNAIRRAHNSRITGSFCAKVSDTLLIWSPGTVSERAPGSSCLKLSLEIRYPYVTDNNVTAPLQMPETRNTLHAAPSECQDKSFRDPSNAILTKYMNLYSNKTSLYKI